MSSYLANAGYLAILAIGFGFVVFWHELGHFLAAKWAGVKVEQFAVGFMQAVVSYRKGLGFRFGSSQKEFHAKLEDWLTDTSARQADGTAEKIHGNAADGWADGDLALAAARTGIGETEYRLNWLPLGGYVKMLGQDDLKPNSEADDPRAYNRQTIAKRMVIVSAGVIMNVILGAVGFMILFSIGFHVPPPKVGLVYAGSPAQLAKADKPEDNGLRVGDEVLEWDGKAVHDDYTKLQLHAALSAAGEEIPVKIRRDGKEMMLKVAPVKMGGMVVVGIGGSYDLTGLKSSKDKEILEQFNDPAADKLYSADELKLKPDETIIAVNGQAVTPSDFPVFNRAVQTGERVQITVRTTTGQIEQRAFLPSFASPFADGSGTPFNLLGLVPRMQVEHIDPKKSPARGHLLPGDVLTEVAIGTGGKVVANPDFKTFKSLMDEASTAGSTVSLKLLRNGEIVTAKNLKPVEVSRGSYGLYMAVGQDEKETVVASVIDGSPTAGKGLAKCTIVGIDGQKVSTWQDVHLALRKSINGRGDAVTVKVDYKTEGGDPKQIDLALAAKDIQAINQVQYAAGLQLQPTEGIRQASNVGQAIQWGVVETRDFILQFYLTLRRMVTRDVDATNLMGPVGIFQAGTHFASKGNDWLIWFLSMISANLAVVNFLPIPVVDGGLFAFLIAEKIKGKPISPRTQAIAQYVGLALLLGIFLFVTYQDIANFQFRMR